MLERVDEMLGWQAQGESGAKRRVSGLGDLPTKHWPPCRYEQDSKRLPPRCTTTTKKLARAQVAAVPCRGGVHVARLRCLGRPSVARWRSCRLGRNPSQQGRSPGDRPCPDENGAAWRRGQSWQAKDSAVTAQLVSWRILRGVTRLDVKGRYRHSARRLAGCWPRYGGGALACRRDPAPAGPVSAAGTSEGRD